MFQGRGGHNDPHPSNIVYIWTLVLEDEIYLPNFTWQNSPYEILHAQILIPNFTWQIRTYEICSAILCAHAN